MHTVAILVGYTGIYIQIGCKTANLATLGKRERGERGERKRESKRALCLKRSRREEEGERERERSV